MINPFKTPQYPQNNPKNDLTPEPTLYTVIQSFAAKLRQNKAKNEIPINLTPPTITTKQGLHVIL